MGNPAAQAAAVQQYGPLAADQVWIDTPGPASIYYPKNILDFDGMTASDYLSNFKGRIKNAIEGRRFDTRRVTAGAATVKGEVKFFNLAKGEATTTIDTGATAYNKDDFDTDMEQNGQMEKGTALLVDSVEVEVFGTHREFGALAAAQPTTFAVSATDTLAFSNTLVGIQRTCRFELKKKRELLSKGRLTDYPPQGGFSGVLGGATSEGILQNGFGFRKQLREIIVLAENYLFDFSMFMDVDIAAWPYATEIRVSLCGLELEAVGGL